MEQVGFHQLAVLPGKIKLTELSKAVTTKHVAAILFGFYNTTSILLLVMCRSLELYDENRYTKYRTPTNR